ncbi:fungal hydrophobin-domain-containing protein [Xylaria cubensis]|nr:fungal hydrophobin-domain-containing protein [Xylaria cubensis]
MRYSILFTTVLATAVAAGPIDLLKLGENNDYPTSSSTSPAGGYPTGYPTTTTSSYPTTKPGGGSSTTTTWGQPTTTTTKKPTTTTTWGGSSTTSSTKKPTTTTTWGGNPTTSSTTKQTTTTTWGTTTTKPGGGSSTSTTKPGGGSTTTTTKPGGGNPTTTTSSATSTPTGGSYFACPDGLYSVPQCCATDVLGVADLDCHSPASVPSSANNFRDICAAGGDRARCCVIPILGQSVLCETPAGLGEQ